MSPSITEILFELGQGDRVVGVTNFCSYPKEACKLPKIGGLINPSKEIWIQLKPDLIILQKGSQKLERDAHQLNLKTLSVSMGNIKNIFDSIHTIGKSLGNENRAKNLGEKVKKQEFKILKIVWPKQTQNPYY